MKTSAKQYSRARNTKTSPISRQLFFRRLLRSTAYIRHSVFKATNRCRNLPFATKMTILAPSFATVVEGFGRNAALETTALAASGTWLVVSHVAGYVHSTVIDGASTNRLPLFCLTVHES